MIKQIPIEDLKVGMYVSDANTKWIPHGPKTKEGKILKEGIIEKLCQMGVKHVYIDTEKGIDADGLTRQEVEADRQEKLDVAAENELAYGKKTEASVEMGRAIEIHHEAKDLVDRALDKVRAGEGVDVNVTTALADNIVGSVLRNQDALLCLGRIRNKDSYLMEHSINLSVLMTAFGKIVGLPEHELQESAVGALLHDIGKIYTPDDILYKPARLDKNEFEIIKEHVVRSKELLENTPGIAQLSITVAAQHHERFDGSGYPCGLKGCQISYHGRMVAIVDVYDAITADRVYHKGIPPTQALKKLLEWSNSHFDLNLVHDFIRCIGVYPVGTVVRLKSKKLAIVTEQHEKDQRTPKVKIVFDERLPGFTKPKDVDLSKPSVQDEIVGTVNPEQYEINIADYLLTRH